MSASTRRRRVLVIAEEANPRRVSVPLIGYRLSRALAERCDVHLVTQVRNDEALREAGLDAAGFTAIDSEPVARPLRRLGRKIRGGAGRGWTTIAALDVVAYYWFERLVWKQFAGALAAGAWDIVHRITPLSPTRPSILAPRCRRLGVPFVLGPLNGGLPWPATFRGRRHAEREWLSYLRSAYRLLPGHRAMLRCAAAVIAGSRATAAQMPAHCRDRCVYIPENAVELPEKTGWPARRRRRPGEPLRVAFVGRLVPYKGADMLIDAIAPLVHSGEAVLDVIGDGPQMQDLRRRALVAGVDAAVTWRGWIGHDEVVRRLGGSDVLALPSIREFGGGVVLEAMSLGVVPVVVDYGGPGELVTPATGRLVPIGTRESITAGFREALRSLTADPAAVSALGCSARRRVHEHFTWQRKAEQILEVYDWVLGDRAAKPEFGMPFPDVDEAAAERGAGADAEAEAAVLPEGRRSS